MPTPARQADCGGSEAYGHGKDQESGAGRPNERPTTVGRVRQCGRVLLPIIVSHTYSDRTRGNRQTIARASGPRTARVLRTIGESFKNFAVVATREAELKTELGRVPDVVANVPNFEIDIYDVAGLARIGDALFGG